MNLKKENFCEEKGIFQSASPSPLMRSADAQCLLYPSRKCRY